MASCWIEVNLGAIVRNYRAIQELVGDGVQIISVVKANAYGHGAIEVSRALSQAGASTLAVTRVEEAIPIREAGVLSPILLLAPAPPSDVAEILHHDLTACIASYDDAERLSQAAKQQNKTARAHLKIDTGMNRFGISAPEAVEIARRVSSLPNLKIEAAFTHFAFAGGSMKDTPRVHAQFALFQPLVRQISHAIQISPTGFHCANSAAIIRFPSMRLSCVRAGTILYGQMPSTPTGEAATQQRFKLENTFQAKAKVLQVRSVRSGETVGYGGEWKAPKNSRIAVIGIGFADGFAVEPQTRQEAPLAAVQKSARTLARDAARGFGLVGEAASRSVTIGEKRAPVVGRIAMQTATVNVTQIEGVKPGDEILVSMRRTSAGAHLPRKYSGMDI